MLKLTAEQCAQAQLDAYNAHDLDAFMAVYAEDTVISQLASGQVQMTGAAQMRERYGRLFTNAPQINAGLVNRITLGDFVIDHERVTGRPDGTENQAAAIYYAPDGLIRQVWFVHETPTDDNPVDIIEVQLAAYNARDTHAFAATYSPETCLTELLSGKAVMVGRDAVYEHYAPVHANSSDIFGKIVNRMVLGAYVIDQEYITGRLGKTVEAILVYEIQNNLINRAWFVR